MSLAVSISHFIQARSGHALRSKSVEKKNQSGDKELLLETDSDASLSPEHKYPLLDENESPLKALQPNNQEFAATAKGNVLQLDKVSNGPMFVITGAPTGESETDIIENKQSKRTSKINMIAESVFGVPTKQAVAEAQANVC